MKRIMCLLMVMLSGVFVVSVSALGENITMPAWGKYVASGYVLRGGSVLEFDPNVGHSFLIHEGLFVADFDGDGVLKISTLGEDDWVTYTDHGIFMSWGQLNGFISLTEGLTTFALRYPNKSLDLFVLTYVENE